MVGHASPRQDLLVFLTGTSGAPFGVINFLKVAADAGYRAIGLEYDDLPAASQVCQRERDRSCYERFRAKRIYGANVTNAIDDLPAESIVNRLTKLLEYLDRSAPGEGWREYLENGKPKWERIAVAGHSQGAGMAAFIAKHERVARVILFSGPQDYYGWDHEIASWITGGKSATPMERWYSAYHKKELEANALKHAYQALHIPRDHVRMMTLDPQRKIGNNPYHVSMVGLATPLDADGKPAYASEWSLMLGAGTRPQSEGSGNP
jgi:dienelactone hydrolase